MKKHLLFLFVALLPMLASAHDFEVDGIYYNITSEADKTAEVTFKGDDPYEYSGEYSGSVTIPATVTYNGVQYGVTRVGDDAFYGCRDLLSVTIPEGVTSIGISVFSTCPSLTTVIIPTSVTSIGDWLCPGCSSLTSINIPEGVTSIGYGAFWSCHSLTSIIIPESVTSIGEKAFQDCPKLTSITIPKNVTSIGSYAFRGCSSLTDMYCYAETLPSVGNEIFNSSNVSNATLYVPASALNKYKTTAPWSSFGNIIGLDAGKVEINSIWYNLDADTKQAEVTFRGDDRDEYSGEYSGSVTIPATVTYNGVQYGVTRVGDDAFYGCGDLLSVTIPEGVTSIGISVFSTCPSLTTVIIPTSVTSIGDWLCPGCSSLTSINIPEGVTSIGYGAFWSCHSLTSIILPESVTSIGEKAFQDCPKLTSITIPKNVTSIGNNAFAYCPSLTAITCHAVIPPTIGNSETFRGVDKSIPVNVPEGSVEAYKTAEYWSEFTNIRPIEADIAEGDYYLKHVGSGKFLTGANNWGTQASLGDYGISITLERLPNGKYTLDTHVANTATDHYLGSIGNTGYVDAPVAEWIISESESGTYTLTLDGTNYWGYDGSSTVLETTLSDPTKRNAQWQLVTRAELESTLSRATLNRGIDATFLIQGHSFNRNHNENAAWMGGPVLGGPMSNFCAEKWNATPVDVYQELAGIPNGYYTLEVQGFYRDAEDPTITAERRAMGTEQLRARLYAGDRSVALMSILDEATPEQSDGGLPTTYGWVPNTMSEAASYFAWGLYPNKVDAWVTDGTLRIGIRKESGESGDWVIFDNFRLTYYGSQKPAGIEQPGSDEAPLLIYDLMGRKVTDTENLTGGIYIIGGRKVVIK